MQTVYILGLFVFTSLLVIIASMQPRRSALSMYELERRHTNGSQSAAEELKRELLLNDILSVKQVVEALLVVCVVIASVSAFGGVFGVLAALVIALGYGRVGHNAIVHGLAGRVYDSYEPGLIQLLERYPSIGKSIRAVASQPGEVRFCSREELEHMVKSCGQVLSEDEKKFITNGLNFNQKTVESIMTPRGVIESIDKNELIGPLTLNDLHKTGHSRFPVTDGDIDHAVGILHIRDLLTVGKKDSETAGKAMEPKVYYIAEEQTLQHALAAFLKTRHHMFVVVNGYRETAGILTLEDVVEALLGRKIVDEFDVHDDLRAVAQRGARSNNNPPHATDV